MKTFTIAATLSAVSFALVKPAAAATVTTLDGSQKWYNSYDTTATATSAITADQPRNGNGSVKFQTNSAADKAVVGYFNGTLGTLGNLANGLITFDYYRDGSSTTPASQSPSFKFYVSDPNGGSASLTWERVYNQPGNTDAPTNQWTDNESLASQLFYINKSGVSYSQAGNYMTLAQFATGQTVSDGSGNTSIALSPNTLITGIELGVGSGLGPVFTGYVDDVNVAFANGGQTVTANFEAVPEPATVALLGLAGVGMMMRRRRATI